MGDRGPLDLHAAALPATALRPQLLRALHPAADGARWRAAALEAGLLAPVPAVADPDDPRAWLGALQGLIAERLRLDESLTTLRLTPVRPSFGDAPLWAWLLLAAQPLIALNLGTWLGDTHESRLMHAMLAWVVPGAAVGLVLVLGWTATQARRAARARALAADERALAEVQAGLREGVEALCGRAFVARIDGRLLVNAAPAEALRAEARAARARDPAAAAALDARAAALEARLMQLLTDPPAGWAAP
jgi:hypothetical protein